jgi:16S rRNA (uracil1498-N3)-methyltransferase
MRYFYLEPFVVETDISGHRVMISGPDARHIQKVLRLKPNDPIGLFDGLGVEYQGKILSFTHTGVEVEIIDRRPVETESPTRIVVAQGFLKETKMDGIVRQLTELGITGWIPFMASRSVARPDPNQLEKRMIRWNAISQQAIKQCRRGKALEIGETLTYEQAIKTAGDFDVKIAFWENEPRPLGEIADAINKNMVHSVFVLLGPEGGLTQEEIELARDFGFIAAGLGPRILRAETATLTACALVQFLFGDMGKKILTST